MPTLKFPRIPFLNRGVKATSGLAPFIGPGDPRYDLFMGIRDNDQVGNSPWGRIAIANRAVWVYACVQARTNAIKGVPLKLYKANPDGEDEEVDDHPVMRLLEDINPTKDTPATFRVDLEQSLSIHGRWQVKKVRNFAGVVKELYGLPVQDTQVIPQMFNRQLIDRFRYFHGGGYDDYAPTDVIYFRYNDFAQSVEGLGPLQVAIETTQADVNLTRAQNAVSRNGARPSMIVTVKNKLLEEDFERMTDELQRQYGGIDNAGKIMVIDNAQDTGFEKYQLSPKDMEWIKEHTSHVADICAAFRTPPVVAFDFTNSAVEANVGGSHRLFWELWVLPELDFLADQLNWQLLWSEDWGRGVGWERKNGLYLKHDTSNTAALREDENARSARASQAFQGGGSINEVRAMRGLDPLPDERGDVILVPSNLTTLDSVLGQPQKPDTDTDDDDSAIAEEAEVGEDDLTETDQTTSGGDELSSEAKADLVRWKKVAQRSIPRALAFKSVFIPLAMQRRIRRDLAIHGVKAFNAAKTSPVLVEMERSLGDALSHIALQYQNGDYDQDKARKEFRKQLMQFYMALLLMYGHSIDEQMGQAEIENALNGQMGFFDNFLSDMADGNLSDAQVAARAKSYARSLTALEKRLMLRQNPSRQFMWQLGENEDHCHDCPELNGKTKTAQEWLDLNLYPRSGQTECLNGCQCDLVPVDEV